MLLFSISTSELSGDLGLLPVRLPGEDALIMVVHRDREGLLGEFLADDVAVEFAPNVDRLDQVHLGVASAAPRPSFPCRGCSCRR